MRLTILLCVSALSARAQGWTGHAYLPKQHGTTITLGANYDCQAEDDYGTAIPCRSFPAQGSNDTLLIAIGQAEGRIMVLCVGDGQRGVIKLDDEVVGTYGAWRPTDSIQQTNKEPAPAAAEAPKSVQLVGTPDFVAKVKINDRPVTIRVDYGVACDAIDDRSSSHLLNPV
jgi:hypothetical protein